MFSDFGRVRELSEEQLGGFRGNRQIHDGMREADEDIKSAQSLRGIANLAVGQKGKELAETLRNIRATAMLISGDKRRDDTKESFLELSGHLESI